MVASTLKIFKVNQKKPGVCLEKKSELMHATSYFFMFQPKKFKIATEELDISNQSADGLGG